jgi:hypothetical protein
MSTFEGFDEDSDDIREIYTFRYSDGDRHISFTTEKNNDYWPDVLDKFLDFLGSVYGYDIRKNVTVKESQGSLNFGDDIGDF